MIMKSPNNQTQPAKQESIGEHKINRLVGGRESSKTFRKELKRYTLVDVLGGSPTINQALGGQADFIHIGPYNFQEDLHAYRRTDTAFQKKRTQRLNSKLGPMKVASISLLA